jgi:hypothetical protein
MLRLRDDRGDILVTPAIIVAAVATTLVLGALTFFATRSVAPNIGGARQQLTLDDDGNIVGGVGVVPVATATPKPTPEPTEEPVVVTQPRPVRTQAPAAQPTPDNGTVIVVTPTEDPHVDQGEENTHNSGETDHDTPEPHEDCCEQDPHAN